MKKPILLLIVFIVAICLSQMAYAASNALCLTGASENRSPHDAATTQANAGSTAVVLNSSLTQPVASMKNDVLAYTDQLTAAASNLQGAGLVLDASNAAIPTYTANPPTGLVSLTINTNTLGATYELGLTARPPDIISTKFTMTATNTLSTPVLTNNFANYANYGIGETADANKIVSMTTSNNSIGTNTVITVASPRFIQLE